MGIIIYEEEDLLDRLAGRETIHTTLFKLIIPKLSLDEIIVLKTSLCNRIAYLKEVMQEDNLSGITYANEIDTIAQINKLVEFRYRLLKEL